MSRFEVRYEHFKREDTTNSMVINLYNDDGTAITPNSGHTWVGKIAKDDKYVGEYPLTISGTKIILPSSSLTRLPFGEYQLELWETTGGQTTIYPNAEFIPVTIHRNADDTMGEVDPTTDINKIIADLKTAGTNLKVGSTTTLAAGSQAAVSQTIANGQNTINFSIPRGAQGEQGNVGPAPTLKIGTVTKLDPDQTPTANLSGGNGSYTLDMGIPQGPQGPTGTVDNAGLISAPAFQSLQTQVDNSAVGTNLLNGSRGPFTPNSNPSNYDNILYTSIIVYLEEGTTYTISASSNGNFTSNHDSTTESDNIVLWLTNSNLGNTDQKFSTIISSQTTGTTGTTFTWRQPSAYAVIRVNSYHKNPIMHVEKVKLEKGSKATDWCPNPSEIMTQADYARIKAAIVALGGSLS